jgi:hypothetical protein
LKRRRRHVELSERQQLILALLLVMLVAISLLYCLGLASLFVRQAWHDANFPWNGVNPTEEMMNATPAVPAAEPTLPATAGP